MIQRSPGSPSRQHLSDASRHSTKQVLGQAIDQTIPPGSASYFIAGGGGTRHRTSGAVTNLQRPRCAPALPARRSHQPLKVRGRAVSGGLRLESAPTSELYTRRIRRGPLRRRPPPERSGRTSITFKDRIHAFAPCAQRRNGHGPAMLGRQSLWSPRR